jgi:hypothetical protein
MIQTINRLDHLCSNGNVTVVKLNPYNHINLKEKHNG